MVRLMILGFVGFRDSFTFRERAPRICGVFGQAVPSPAEQNFYEDRKAAKYPNAHLYVRSWSGPAASDNRRSSLEDTLWGSSKASPTTSRPPRPRTRSRSKSARLYAVHYWNDSTLAIHCCGDDEREQTHECDSRTRYVRILPSVTQLRPIQWVGLVLKPRPVRSEGEKAGTKAVQVIRPQSRTY